MTLVVNVRTHVPTPLDLKISRGTRWGNPFRIGVHGTRPEVIAKYRARLWAQVESGEVLRSDLAALHGRTLVCFCAPEACHGDVLKAAAAWAVGVTSTEKEI